MSSPFVHLIMHQAQLIYEIMLVAYVCAPVFYHLKTPCVLKSMKAIADW